MNYWVVEYKIDKEDSYGAVAQSLSQSRSKVRDWLIREKYYLGFGFRRVYPYSRIVKLERG